MYGDDDGDRHLTIQIHLLFHLYNPLLVLFSLFTALLFFSLLCSSSSLFSLSLDLFSCCSGEAERDWKREWCCLGKGTGLRWGGRRAWVRFRRPWSPSRSCGTHSRRSRGTKMEGSLSRVRRGGPLPSCRRSRSPASSRPASSADAGLLPDGTSSCIGIDWLFLGEI